MAISKPLKTEMKMNLFRRRSSVSTSPPSTPTTSTTSTTTAMMMSSTTTTTTSTNSNSTNDKNGATASLRRVFLPRSKTASSNLSSGTTNSPSSILSSSKSSNGSLLPSSVTTVTNWSYLEPRVPPVSVDGSSTLQRRPPPPMPPSRTASLNRNFNHSRSVTMPNMQEHQQQQQHPQQQQQDLAHSFARTFSTFRRHPESSMRRMSSVERSPFSSSPSMPSSTYMTLSSTSTISASVSIHGGLSTAPRFQQRQSRLQDQQQQQHQQQLPQQLSQQQMRRRPRPLSADMSLTRAPYNTYANNNHNNVHPMSMSSSKSEFFRVVRNRLMEEFEGPDDPRHHSSESLLADSSSVSQESSLDYFVNKDHSNIEEDDDEDIETPTPTTPEASSHCRKAISSLDSLLDNESSGAGMSMQSQQLTMSSRAKSNSLPKSAFGSLQLKVQEIRAQLDVLKTSSEVRRVFQQVCPPPRPQGQDNTQHPNTPAHGFEYMMPPNVVQEQSSSNASWSNYFPVFPTSAIDASGCSNNPDRRPLFPTVHSHQQQHHQQQQSSMFQSPPSSSQDTDSVSPLSMSPSRTSSPATAQQAATLSLSIAPSNMNNSAAVMAMMGTSGSSSPSTLSASSSNSLPTSVSRPSVLKIPHSQSLNSFPYNGNNNNNNNNNNCNNNLKNYSKGYFDDDAAVSQVGRLFFFYDVLSTQEKISKVGVFLIKEEY